MTEEQTEPTGIQNFSSPIQTQPIPTAIRLAPCELTQEDAEGNVTKEFGFEITLAHAAGVNVFYGPEETLQDIARQALAILKIAAQRNSQKLVVASMDDIRSIGMPRSEPRS